MPPTGATMVTANADLPPTTRARGGEGSGRGARCRKEPNVQTDHREPRGASAPQDATEVEKKLWQHLRQPPFKHHHFRRQATIGPYFADFASHQLKLVIEVDGGQHADNASDEKRTRYLQANGYRVLRFWNNDVLENMPGVLSTIDTAVNPDRPPTPTPSPPQTVEGRE